MNQRRIFLAASAGALALCVPASAECPGRFAVEVLGSGGPLADDDRASTGYLVWIDGEARLLVDAGGGVFLRFGEAVANLENLDAILISHFHADHVADLAAILKSGFFEDREASLPIAGPAGNTLLPGLSAFLAANFDAETGAYRYLSGYLTGKGGTPRLAPVEMDPQAENVTTVVEAGPLKAEAIPVNHGDVPALAYAVTVDGATVIFAGDQSLFSTYFEEALDGSAPALLIAHHAISEAKGQPRGLHRAPSSIGEMAARLKAKRLVLSHNMKRALDAREDGLRAIGSAYEGPVEIAGDHSCYAIVE
ncbi:MAG: MBL fold metallo-hydrolase [Amphiplicatus sp.]